MKTELQQKLDLAAQNKVELAKTNNKLKRTKPKNLDDVAHQAHDDAFKKIDCLQCANCCKTTSPTFYERDIDRLGLNQVASITQIASGHYRVRIRRKGIQAINMTFPEKKDAESWANAMEKRIDLCGASIHKQTLEQRIEDSMESTSQPCQAHDEPAEPALIAPAQKLGWNCVGHA